MGGRFRRKLVLMLGLLLPNNVALWLYRRVLRWQIGSNVRLGFSWIDCDDVELADGVRIGHFNLIRGLTTFRVGANTYLLRFNEISAPAYEGWARSFSIGADSGIMSRHFFDASGGITIGDQVIVAGRSSQIWTHQKFKGHGALEPKGVRIGSGIYIAATVLIAPGVSIADGCVVGLGAVVARSVTDEGALIVGNPAEAKLRRS